MKKTKVLLVASCFSVFFSFQAFAGWIQVEDGQWKYDKNGTVVTSNWVEDQGNWYYLDDSGNMLYNITRNINGVNYTFDSSGKWIDQNSTTQNTYKSYTNTEIGFSLQIPSNIATTAFDGNSESFEISSSNMEIGFYNKLDTANINPAIYADVFESSFIRGAEDSSGKSITLIEKTTSQLGEFTVSKSRYYFNEYINLEFYNWVHDNKMFVIYTYYTPDAQSNVQAILSTLKKLQ